MPSVLPTERIAHLGSRLLHPSPWAERDDRDHAVENFFQGGSPKQATPFLRQDLLTARNRFRPNFRGWRLDENLKPKSPPYRGAIQKSPYRGVSSIARIAAKQIVTQTRSKKC